MGYILFAITVLAFIYYMNHKGHQNESNNVEQGKKFEDGELDDVKKNKINSITDIYGTEVAREPIVNQDRKLDTIRDRSDEDSLTEEKSNMEKQ